VTTTASLPSPATAAQSASLPHSLSPAVSPYASTEVRYSTITESPTIVTFCGLPPIVVCQRETPAAIGSLVLIQAQTRGHGFQTWVVARTTTSTMAASA
jgi:hypothetical protein